MALGIDRSTGTWHVAGARQSEYQAWLAGDGLGDRFIDAALRCLQNNHGLGGLCFEYLPPGVPLAWTGYRRWRQLCSTESQARPLMAVDDRARLAAILKKKHNRSHYNRLKRQGDLRLVEIMCRDATVLANVDRIYASVGAADSTHRQALEKIGFRRSQLPAGGPGKTPVP